ncbi:MAG: bacteriohemerythrin [Azonexus sp.]|jgi:hemerythrin-like metal-binding protein|nr:bacteriohemerythrin [Azonexus sp.]
MHTKSTAPLVIWQDKYALGLDEIDEQHKTLFNIMNHIWEGIVHNADAASMIGFLEELERYTISHFTEEEVFMRGIEYPNIDSHIAQHHTFVQHITNEKIKAQRGQKVSLELLHFLRNWLVNHILVEDKRYEVHFHSGKRSKSILGRFFAKLR